MTFRGSQVLSNYLACCCFASLASLASCTGTVGSDQANYGSGSGNCDKPNQLAAGPAPLVRLSSSEYMNTLKDLFPKVSVAGAELTAIGEVQSDGFLNTAEAQAPSAAAIEAFAGNAAVVAKLVASDVTKILPCTAASPAEEASCGAKFIETFGKQAFRRPLTTTEKTRFGSFLKDASGKWGFPVAVRMVTEAFLQSPSFLYRIESSGKTIGGAIALDNYEVASRLSYLLTDTMPDAALMDAADAGRLTSAAGVKEQARRLLKTERAREAVASFHAQWLRFEKMDKLAKAADVYPNFDATMAAALKDATVKYVDRMFWDEGHKLQSFLTDNHAYVNSTLAPLYGTTASGSELVWTELDEPGRSGILTQAGLLAGLAHERNDAPVLRGIFVLDRLLCQPPPSPPADVNTTLPPLTESANQTTRQQLEASHATPKCASCHKSIDGIGFGFGNFDALGQYRTKEFGLDVDATGEFVGTDIDGKFDGAADMGRKLASSQQVSACLATQWLGYALAVRRENLDACMTDPLVKALGDANGDLRELVVALVASDAFRHRASTP